MYLWKIIVNSFKTRGFRGTVSWFINGYFRVKKFIVFHRKLNSKIEEVENQNIIRFKKLNLKEYKELIVAENDLPFEFYCHESHGFTTPYIALVANKIAAIIWLVLPGQKSRFLILDSGSVEINYGTVLPGFRGNRLAHQLMSFIMLDCENKYNNIFGVVSVENIPQYKPMLRLGFEPVECLTHFFLNRPKATLKYVEFK